MTPVAANRILVMGDVIPQSETPESRSGSGWCHWLDQLLTLRCSPWRVEDVTRPGWTAHKMMEHMTDDVLLDVPHALIIHAGRSDAEGCLAGDRWAKEPGPFLDSLRESIRRFRTRRPTGLVLLLTPVLTSLDSSPFRQGPLLARLPVYADALATLATQERATFIPSQRLVWEALSRSRDDGALGYDVHGLDLRGCLLIAESVASSLGAEARRAPTGMASGEVVVAIGDSITDAGRREPLSRPLGRGFVAIAQALQEIQDPQARVTWINRGVGGDTMVDIESRWQRDVLCWRPHRVALNGGLNDCNRRYAGRGDGIEPVRYGEIIARLFERTRAELPQVRLLMLGPYCLTRDDHPGSYLLELRERLPEYVAAAQAACQRLQVPFIDAATVFDPLLDRLPYRRIAGDGIHPDGLGSLALAEAWLDGHARGDSPAGMRTVPGPG